MSKDLERNSFQLPEPVIVRLGRDRRLYRMEARRIGPATAADQMLRGFDRWNWYGQTLYDQAHPKRGALLGTFLRERNSGEFRVVYAFRIDEHWTAESSHIPAADESGAVAYANTAARQTEIDAQRAE